MSTVHILTLGTTVKYTAREKIVDFLSHFRFQGRFYLDSGCRRRRCIPTYTVLLRFDYVKITVQLARECIFDSLRLRHFFIIFITHAYVVFASLVSI